MINITKYIDSDGDLYVKFLSEDKSLRIQKKFNDLTVEELKTINTALEVKLIEQRKQDGQSMCTWVKASLRNFRLENNISIELYNQYVYMPTRILVSEIDNGDFLNAYLEIQTITPNTYLVSEMLLKYKNSIADYIINKGQYSDYAGKTFDPLTGIIS